MNPDETYLRHVSRAHIEASVAALSELAELASTKQDKTGARLLRLRLGHLDHGGFLTNILHGFAVMEVEQNGRVSGVEDEGEILYAIVLNHTVDLQIRTTLSLIASFLARQDLVRTMMASDKDGLEFDSEVADSDLRAAVALEDALRVKDWRDAASELRLRAEGASLRLEVQFASPLLSQDEIRRRVPAVRRVYNQVPLARYAVDRTAAAMSLGLTVRGTDVPETLMASARDLLDVGEVRRYVAHLARDAFVCGNGFLEVKPPPGAFRMLRPEDTEVIGLDLFQTFDSRTGVSESIQGDRLLHLRGMHQVGGLVGASVLEPLVIILAQTEVAENAVEEGVPIALAADTEHARDWAKRAQDFASRITSDNERRVAEILGSGPLSFSTAPSGLYFSGQTDMTPASPRLHFRDRSSS